MTKSIHGRTDPSIKSSNVNRLSARREGIDIITSVTFIHLYLIIILSRERMYYDNMRSFATIDKCVRFMFFLSFNWIGAILNFFFMHFQVREFWPTDGTKSEKVSYFCRRYYKLNKLIRLARCILSRKETFLIRPASCKILEHNSFFLSFVLTFFVTSLHEIIDSRPRREIDRIAPIVEVLANELIQHRCVYGSETDSQRTFHCVLRRPRYLCAAIAARSSEQKGWTSLWNKISILFTFRVVSNSQVWYTRVISSCKQWT